jgi:hypothetical protein
LTGADVAAIITTAGGATASILGGIALLQKKADRITRAEREECDECSARRRALVRWVNKLLDLLAEHGIAEPEGIEDELRLRRQVAAGPADGEEA